MKRKDSSERKQMLEIYNQLKKKNDEFRDELK